MKLNKSRSTLLAAMLLVLCCAFTLQGCSDPKAAAAGTYEVDKVAIKAAAEAEIKAKGKDDPSSGAAAAMMRGMIDQMVMTVTLNADGTAEMHSSMMGQTNNATGTWTISGDAITITETSAGGKPKPVTGTLSGDTLTMQPPEGQKLPFDLVFKKKKG